ncbi:MAG: ABC transporter permease [Deltaproteobacteria bacterium]|nr:ABC transporter permease [Deltaproteobacteria bacterium]MBT6488446.1 ABC transporter permease [Deltaproteobacteria bacterium]
MTWAVFGLVHLAALVWVLRKVRLKQFDTTQTLRGIVLGLFLLFPGVMLFEFLGLSLERSAGVSQSMIALGALLLGASFKPKTTGMAAREFTVAVCFLTEIGAGLGLWMGQSFALSSPFTRLLLVVPPLVLLLGYLGLSVRYLLVGKGKGRGFGYESLVGRRFLLSKSSPALSVVTAISVVGVTLGVWLVVVSLAILSGFEHDLRQKIIGAHAHILIQDSQVKPFDLTNELVDALAQTPGVEATAAYIEGEVAVASRSNFNGGVLMGIDAKTSPKVLKVLAGLSSESLAGLKVLSGDSQPSDDPFAFSKPVQPPGIILGAEMARALSVKLGDDVRVISPMLEVLTPVGPAPKSRGFRVVGIFSSKMYEYDSRFAYVDIEMARTFFELADGQVTGLQVQAATPEMAPDVVANLSPVMKVHSLEARDWRRRNQTLFAALELERVIAFIVLAFIILVASFSIVTTLAMSIIEKRQEIAILKTIGARSTGIMKIFLTQGMVVGGLGTLMGGICGLITVSGLEQLGLWIPDEVYYIDSLPVHLSVADLVVVMVAALLIVWDFAIFPALQGASLEPVEGLREG